MKNPSLFLFLIILTAFACTSNTRSSDSNEVLSEAFRYHDQSLDLREEIMDMEKQLKENNTDYSRLKEELKIWDKDIIEVPGYEHSHDDEHQRRYHVHNPMKSMSDDEHIEYQKMMYAEIQQLHEQFLRLLAPDVMEDSDALDQI
jgi:hypothetical protein